MYFLTAQDKNYQIKGSRDPLGFQVIWQKAGRALIPAISTVSNSIKDFQIFAIAHIYKEKYELDDSSFARFFIPFEQMMAFIRLDLFPKEGFNGITKMITQKRNYEGKQEFPIGEDYQILQKQIAYGIWGKYVNPTKTMAYLKDEHFNEIFEEKAALLPQNIIEKLAKKAKENNKSYTIFYPAKLDKEKAKKLFKISAKEKSFWEAFLLDSVAKDDLLETVQQKPLNENRNLDKSYLLDLVETSKNDKVKEALEKIMQTESVIGPIDRVFRYLQTKRAWNLESILKDSFITGLREHLISVQKNLSVCKLDTIQLQDNSVFVESIIKRNASTMEARSSMEWMEIVNSNIYVNHFEGSKKEDTKYNPSNTFDNNYFLGSFINLYNQLNTLTNAV